MQNMISGSKQTHLQSLMIEHPYRIAICQSVRVAIELSKLSLMEDAD